MQDRVRLSYFYRPVEICLFCNRKCAFLAFVYGGITRAGKFGIYRSDTYIFTITEVMHEILSRN